MWELKANPTEPLSKAVATWSLPGMRSDRLACRVLQLLRTTGSVRRDGWLASWRMICVAGVRSADS